MMHYINECLAWFGGSVVMMSFGEHQIHRHLMHRKSFLSAHVAALKKVFEHHAIQHHGHYYKSFHDEPVARGEDRGIRLSMKEGFLEALPISAVIAIVSWPGAVIFEIIVCLHHFIWNAIHLQMHKPEERFFRGWPLYKFLARHHYLHHRYPDKNFNVVVPIADYVLGTNAPASKADLEVMRQLGYL